MLLYVHVPFCVAKCRYCAFASEAMTPEALGAWEEAFTLEAAYYGERLNTPVVETLYLGGGTPSLLPPHVFERLVDTLKHSFAIAPGIEFTLEANPDSAARANLTRLWREMGVNRVSLGVQSFCEAELLPLGRPHDAGQAVAAVESLRAAGFDNLSIDLIWGLPGQSLASWMKTLNTAVALDPRHISLYGLTLEEGTPLAASAGEGKLVLAGEDETAEMYLQGGDFLEAQGYQHYEISNFALPGFASRHNQGYWEGRDYLGLGPSAVSTIAGARRQNPATVAKYAAFAGLGAWEADTERLTPQILGRERLMLALRTGKGTDLADYRRIMGQDLMDAKRPLLEALGEKGFIRIANGALTLTRRGMLVSNGIIGRLVFSGE